MSSQIPIPETDTKIMNKTITWVVPLELKVEQGNNLMSMVFEQQARLVDFCEKYFSTSRVYANLVSRKFNRGAWEEKHILLPAFERLKIQFSKDMLDLQIYDKILATFEGSYHRRAKPSFDNLKNVVTVRITKTYPENKPRKRSPDYIWRWLESGKLPPFAKGREGQLHLLLDSAGGLVFRFWPFGKSVMPITGRIGHEDNFKDKLRYNEVLNAIKGIEGLEVGQSEIQRVFDIYEKKYRYFVNVVIHKQIRIPYFSKERPKSRLKQKEWTDRRKAWWREIERDAIVIGFDRGMSQYLAAAVAKLNGEEIGRYAVHANGIIKMIRREKNHQRFAKKKFEQGKDPYKKGEVGFRPKRVTKFGESWLKQEVDRQMYRTNNELVMWATELATKHNKHVVLKTEYLGSFHNKTKYYSKMRKIWGKAYHAAKDPLKKDHALEQKREYERKLFYASIFRTGRKVYDDFYQEAHKHGHLVRIVSAKNSSLRCPKCHQASKANRPERDVFKCVSCGYYDEADFVGATNNADA